MNTYYNIDKKQPDQLIQALDSLGIQQKPLKRIDKMICRGVPGLSMDYLLQQKSNNITIYIENSSKKLVGIVIFSLHKKVVKIYVLCTIAGSGQGTVLINIVKDFSRHIGATKIKLEAIQSVIGFYSKMDFVPTGNNTTRSINIRSTTSSSSDSSDSSASESQSKKVKYLEMEYTIKRQASVASVAPVASVASVMKIPTRKYSLQRPRSYNSRRSKESRASRASRASRKLRNTF